MIEIYKFNNLVTVLGGKLIKTDQGTWWIEAGESLYIIYSIGLNHIDEIRQENLEEHLDSSLHNSLQVNLL